MPVTCRICWKDFQVVTHRHLYYKHGMSVDDYRKQFPGVLMYGRETRKKQSDLWIHKGSNNHRKLGSSGIIGSATTGARIYLIENMINGKKYVGVTTWTVEKRWDLHCKNARNGGNTALHNAIRKYGKQSFTVTEIGYYYDIEVAKNKVEGELIELFDSHWSSGNGYNMTYGGEGTVGHKHSESTRERMSTSHAGKRHTEETKALLSRQRLGTLNPNYGKTPSDETRLLMSAATSGANNPRACTYDVTYPDGRVVRIDDRSGFCKEHGLNYWSVCHFTDSGKSCKGFLFVRVN